MVTIPKFKAKQFIAESYRHVASDRFMLWGSVCTLAMIVISAIVYAIIASNLPARVPLYYSLPYGNDWLAPARMLLVLPGISLGIGIVNLICTVLLYKEEQLLSRLVALTSVFVALLNIYTFIRIIFLIL